MTVRQIVIGAALIGILPTAVAHAGLTVYSFSGTLSGYTNYPPPFIPYQNVPLTGTFVLDDAGRQTYLQGATAVYDQPDSMVTIALGSQIAFHNFRSDDNGSVTIKNVALHQASGDQSGLNLICQSRYYSARYTFNEEYQAQVFLVGNPTMITSLAVNGGFNPDQVTGGTVTMSHATNTFTSDGIVVNYTLVGNITQVSLARLGASQYNPILPGSSAGGVFAFDNVSSGDWFDPPLVGSYQFDMTDGKLFTSILALPANIGDTDDLFAVSVNGVALGQFSSAQSVNFADFGFANGVSSFVVSGIDPHADGGNPTSFPIQLAFNSGSASFTMRGLGSVAPEPTSLALLGMTALPIIGRMRRRVIRQPRRQTKQ